MPSAGVITEVSNWLRVLSDGTVDRTWTGPPEALELMSPVPPHSTPKNGLTLIDLPAGPDQPSLRLYLPSPTPQLPNSPILLHFHGGGFCISHFSWLMYHHFYSRLARALPAIVVSVDLPLAPEHPLPAAHLAALQSLLRLPHAPHLQHADLARLFLIGDSSGGNIVHELCSMLGDKAGFWGKLAGGIEIHPGFVRAERSESEGRLEWETPFLTVEMLEKFLALALPEGAGRGHRYTWPVGEDGGRMPPMMVAVAERDLIRDSEMEYCEAMKRAGREVEVFYQTGVGHSFYLNKFAVDGDEVTGRRTEELILAIKDFVHRH